MPQREERNTEVSPYSDFQRERLRAHQKHDGGNSVERMAWADTRFLPIVVEEVGEVARILCDFGDDEYAKPMALREELIQVGAMVSAWIDAIDR